MAVLKESIEAVPDGIPVILDFKRSDIGNTAAMYARSAFEYYGVDAVTVNPYLGIDSIEPFISYKDKGVIVLCLTSNRSSSELQRQLMLIDEVPSMRNLSPQAQAKTIAEFFRYSTIAVYTHIARLAMEWNVSGNIGLVVGATSPKELEKIRQLVGDKIPILIPGVGAQGGDLESAVKLGSNSKGNLAIINVSRSIVYRSIVYSQGGESFPEAVREKAISYREAIYDIAAQKRAK
jgi:orotidine-5'-phosphate decarboxylase